MLRARMSSFQRATWATVCGLGVLLGCDDDPGTGGPDGADDADASVEVGGEDDPDAGDDSDSEADPEPDAADVAADPAPDSADADVDGDTPGEFLPDGDDPDEEEAGPPDPWRSALYPEDWTPAFSDGEGRFLHDFSYAGYHNGEVDPPTAPPGVTVDAVIDHGADPSGETDSTAALQAAIDAVEAAGGGVVFIPAGLYRLDGRLVVQASGVVLRGAGAGQTQLYFTGFAGMSFESHITFEGSAATDLELMLAEDGDARAVTVAVADAGDFDAGDQVALGWTITPEFVEAHGMTGTWSAFNGTWQPFFHRRVVDVDRTGVPHVVTLDVPLRYPALVRDGASLRRQTGLLTECGVEELGLSNAVAWDDAWSVDQVHVLEMSRVADCWIRDVASFASPAGPTEGDGVGAHLQSGGILIVLSQRVTVADSSLGRAQHRGSGGNGYLFEVRQSSEVMFRDLVADGGRHNFIQNWGFGTTGCVWLRVTSRNGRAETGPDSSIFGTGLSEFHHSLATANLIDSCILNDGWGALNRRTESTGAGHTATQNVFWNNAGNGEIRSAQYGLGYVIGSAPSLDVDVSLFGLAATGTEPEDFSEGIGLGEALEPASLYEDQLARRLAAGE